MSSEESCTKVKFKLLKMDPTNDPMLERLNTALDYIMLYEDEECAFEYLRAEVERNLRTATLYWEEYFNSIGDEDE